MKFDDKQLLKEYLEIAKITSQGFYDDMVQIIQNAKHGDTVSVPPCSTQSPMDRRLPNSSAYRALAVAFIFTLLRIPTKGIFCKTLDPYTSFVLSKQNGCITFRI